MKKNSIGRLSPSEPNMQNFPPRRENTVPLLNEDHIKEVLNREIRIGSQSDKGIEFTYNPWTRMYTFWVDGSVCTTNHLHWIPLADYNGFNMSGRDSRTP